MKRKKATPKNRINASARRIGRMRFIAVGIILLFITLDIQLFQMQVIQGGFYAQKARKQHLQRVNIESRRGAILDRRGQELAVDLPQFYTLGVRPGQITHATTLCQELASFTHRPSSHYQRRLSSPSNFVYLEWRLTPEQVDRLRQLNLGSLTLEKTSGRFYPYHRSTSQLLGYTDVDHRGIAGLEVLCDSILQGKKGWETHQRSASGISFWDPLRSCIKPVDGGTVRLSIDAVAQDVLHHELQEALEKFCAEWAGGILIDPESGEILAICSVPDFDPIRPETGSLSQHKLRPVTDLFEPGSVFKIVGATAALDQNIFNIHDSIYCEEGQYRIGKKILRDVHKYGWLTFEDILVNSSNIGTAKVAEMLGAKELYRYGIRYGFGNSTGVSFPGEASGILRPYGEWKNIDLANIAIGQGISVTMLQMAMAYAAIANDGILMEPRLILDQTDAQGHHRPRPPRAVRRVMEPKTAKILQNILVQCVERGTGANAAINGLTIAGKTGTAQIPDLVNGGYFQNRFIASFVGFTVEEENNRLLIISVADPKTAHFGSQVAAPVFKQVLQKLLTADAMRTSRPVNPEIFAYAAVGLDKTPTIKSASLLNPAEDTRLADISPPNSSSEMGNLVKTDVIPDLMGLSLRQAVKLLSKCGVKVEISGSGWVVSQSLKPGSPADRGLTCILTAKP